MNLKIPFIGYIFVCGMLIALSSHAKGYKTVKPYSQKPAKQFSCPGCNPNDHYVQPNTRRNGQRVPGHMKTANNETSRDNFTHRTNRNPYTGKKGTRD